MGVPLMEGGAKEGVSKGGGLGGGRAGTGLALTRSGAGGGYESMAAGPPYCVFSPCPFLSDGISCAPPLDP